MQTISTFTLRGRIQVRPLYTDFFIDPIKAKTCLVPLPPPPPSSLRKQPTIRDTTLVFPVIDVWGTSAKIRYWWGLGSSSDWSCYKGNLLQPIINATQILVLTRHQFGISAVVSQTSFRGKTGVGVGCFLRLPAPYPLELIFVRKRPPNLVILGGRSGKMFAALTLISYNKFTRFMQSSRTAFCAKKLYKMPILINVFKRGNFLFPISFQVCKNLKYLRHREPTLDRNLW